MLISLKLLDEVHDEVDAERLNEDVFHADDERVVYLIQDHFLKMQVFQRVMFNDYIFTYALHCVKGLCMFILYEINLK